MICCECEEHSEHSFLRDIEGLDLIFLATGTGIAPISAMLEELEKSPRKQHPRSLTVYWGNRYAEDFYKKEFAKIENLKINRVLSRRKLDWKEPTGYVQNVFLETQGLSDSMRVYACGSDSMIKDSLALLVNKGFPEDHFLSDAFVATY